MMQIRLADALPAVRNLQIQLVASSAHNPQHPEFINLRQEASCFGLPAVALFPATSSSLFELSGLGDSPSFSETCYLFSEGTSLKFKPGTFLRVWPGETDYSVE